MILEPEERVDDLGAELENLIADFLPDADKNVPRQIAAAVAEHVVLRKQVSLTVPPKLHEVVEKMSIEEYKMFREFLLSAANARIVA